MDKHTSARGRTVVLASIARSREMNGASEHTVSRDAKILLLLLRSRVPRGTENQRCNRIIDRHHCYRGSIILKRERYREKEREREKKREKEKERDDAFLNMIPSMAELKLF